MSEQWLLKAPAKTKGKTEKPRKREPLVKTPRDEGRDRQNCGTKKKARGRKNPTYDIYTVGYRGGI